MEETQDPTDEPTEETVTFAIPQAVKPLLDHVAKKDGWQPVLPGGYANPETAVARLFANAMRAALQGAIGDLAKLAGSQAETAATREMSTITDVWLGELGRR